MLPADFLCVTMLACRPDEFRLAFMTASPIDIYRRQIEKGLQAGDATEHTHRPALKALLQSLASGVTATKEPKRVECGAPDFAVTEKRAHGPVTIGHLEAKDVGKDLVEVEKSEQMKRYLPALPNLILTDYLEFRWYVDGEHRQTARPARARPRTSGGTSNMKGFGDNYKRGRDCFERN